MRQGYSFVHITKLFGRKHLDRDTQNPRVPAAILLKSFPKAAMTKDPKITVNLIKYFDCAESYIG